MSQKHYSGKVLRKLGKGECKPKSSSCKEPPHELDVPPLCRLYRETARCDLWYGIINMTRTE